MTGLWVLILATMAASGETWTTQLSEASLPAFRTASSGELVRWATGPHNMALASAHGVRITDNRIRVLHAPLDATPLFSAPCARHADALCVVTSDGLVDSLGVGNGSLVFPMQQQVHLDPEFKFRGCSRGEGRVVVTGGRYDISACDVFDSNLDIVFQNNRLSVFRVEVDAALYGWLGVTCIVAVVVITQNLAADLFDDSPDAAHPVNILWCVALGVALLVLSALFPGPEADTPGVCSDWRQFSCRLFYPLLTRSDRVFLAGVFLYVLIHILCGLGPTVLHWSTVAAHCFQNPDQKTPPPIRSLHSVNFLVACILVSVVSTHGSAETPLTAPLVFVLLFRAAFKMLKMQRAAAAMADASATAAAAMAGASATDSVLEPFLVASDCLLILGCLVFGVVPNAGSECEAVTFFAMLLAVAVMLAYEAVQRSSSLQTEAQQRPQQQDIAAKPQPSVNPRTKRQAAQMHSHMLSFV